MPVVLDHIIEGNLQNGHEIDFSKEKLAVRAFVNGAEVGQTEVDTTGRFKLTFASEEERPVTELRVTPVETAEGAPVVAVRERLEPEQFSLLENKVTAQKDLRILPNVLEGIRMFRLRYHMFGQVFAQTTFTIEPAPALKMDFYEFSLVKKPGLPVPHFPTLILPKESYLGTAFTDPNGNYDFKFVWGTLLPPPFLLADPQPDILVQISQFDGAVWHRIFTGPVDWNILPSFHRDFLVPATILRPGPCAAPATGFAFTSIGLIPVDKNHLIKGHAFTDANDPQPIAGMTHRPFGDTLRIGGLFAKTPAIAKYKVEFALADENHVPGDGAVLAWENVKDKLTNQVWDPINGVWKDKALGPDPITQLFDNIENQPNFFEPTLKFTFNSAQVTDGFIAFRLTGFDASGTQVGQPVELPVLCIDNSQPLADLEAPKAEKCGGIELDEKVENGKTIHSLDLKVTAYDPKGHVLDFYISATRGAKPVDGDVVFSEISPSIFMPSPGCGIYNQTETVTVNDVPAAFADCPTLAYGVYLGVWGSATNGYSRRLGSQWVGKYVNLMVKQF